jgi:iron complex transport system permease protein
MLNRNVDRQPTNQIRRGTVTTGIVILGILAVLLAIVLSLMLGTVNINIQTVWNAVFHFNPEMKEHQIIHEIHLPRAITAVLVGAYLSVSGAAMQAMTRNPLSEPSLLGVSHGAAFALVLTYTLYPGVSRFGAALSSMFGAGLAVILVFSLTLASKGGLAPVKLSIAGIAIGMFLSSLTSIIALHFNVSKEMSFWYAGGLATSDWNAIKILGVFGVIGGLIVIYLARSLTLMSMSKEVSQGLGINIRLVNILGVLAVLLLTGSSVAIAGAIGFVGLVVPHISRMLVGPDFRFLLPVSTVLGSLLLVLADIGARMINPPYETPIGVVTAAIGVPFFLFLVRTGRSRFE